jgi:hypothetical protein
MRCRSRLLRPNRNHPPGGVEGKEQRPISLLTPDGSLQKASVTPEAA